jgi:hypothetical protein
MEASLGNRLLCMKEGYPNTPSWSRISTLLVFAGEDKGSSAITLRTLPLNSCDSWSYSGEVCRVSSIDSSHSTLQPSAPDLRSKRLICRVFTKRIPCPLVAGWLWSVRDIDKKWERGREGQIPPCWAYGSCPKLFPPQQLGHCAHLPLQSRGGNVSLLFLVPGYFPTPFCSSQPYK